MFLSKPYITVVVDDDEELCEMVKEALEEKYASLLKVYSFSSPVEAFQFVEKNNVLLMISDLNMPEMHGQSLLSQVRDLKKGIKTITMTGSAQLTNSITRFRGGDIGFLIKPFDETLLFKLVDNVLVSLDLWSECIKNVVG